MVLELKSQRIKGNKEGEKKQEKEEARKIQGKKSYRDSPRVTDKGCGEIGKDGKRGKQQER